MKRVVGLLAALGVSTITVAASARDRCHRIDVDIYECAPDAATDDEVGSHLNESGSLEARLAFVSFSPFLADKTFGGSGIPLGGGSNASFAAKGKELGFIQPRTYGGEIDVAYLRRWVRFGGFLGWSVLSPDANATSYGAASIVDGGTMSMLHAGVDTSLVFPFGPARLGLGAAFGGYFTSLQLRGFEPSTCRGRPCYETATATIGFVQPRASLDFDLLSDGDPVVASLGGFVGVDVASERSIAWGVTLSIHEPQESLAP